MPVFATASVKELMLQTEAAKHQQWSSVFGNEWISKWIYPNEIVKNGDTVNIAGLKFTVLDIGSGGVCDANSIWLLEEGRQAAFVGDFLYKANHTYMNDGSILRWLANLDRYAARLKQFKTYYIGHGPACDFSDLAAQREYLLRYGANVLAETDGTGIFTDETRKSFEQKMLTMYPDYGCQFMITLSADRVGKELTSQAEQLQQVH
jgi:glyoxylase-like metal-dependent hydrolase (beta-lactamase superfamily II)